MLTNGELAGEFDSWNRKTFAPGEFDIKLTPNSLKNIVEDKFHAKKKVRIVSKDGKSVKITSYVFDLRILDTLMSKYGIN